MTVAKGCRLYLGLTGSTQLASNEGKYKWGTLTVADGGEVTSTNEVAGNSITLEIGDIVIQGGGALHMKRIFIQAGNFTVDDLGELRGDMYEARLVCSCSSFVQTVT